MGVVSPDRVNITVGTLATSSLRWVQREQTQLLIALLREAEVAGLPPTARSYGPVLLAERWLAGTAVAWWRLGALETGKIAYPSECVRICPAR